MCVITGTANPAREPYTLTSPQKNGCPGESKGLKIIELVLLPSTIQTLNLVVGVHVRHDGHREVCQRVRFRLRVCQ